MHTGIPRITWRSLPALLAILAGLAFGGVLQLTLQTAAPRAAAAPLHATRAPSLPFQLGDIFAGVGLGHILHFQPNGALVETLDTGSMSSADTGMCLDGAGSLYTTNWTAGNMSKFDNIGTRLSFPWGGPFSLHPESCVVDAAGNIYVGEVDGANLIMKYNSGGTLLGSWHPAGAARGLDWIDLAADQCTMFYTSEGSTVKRYNVCTSTQLPDFATGLTAPAYALRIRSNGEVMVATQTELVRLDTNGTVIQHYPIANYPGTTLLFAANLDPNGTSIWTGDYPTGVIYKINIATGAAELHFTAQPQAGSMAGLAIYGELTQGQPTATPGVALTATPAPTVTAEGQPTETPAGEASPTPKGQASPTDIPRTRTPHPTNTPRPGASPSSTPAGTGTPAPATNTPGATATPGLPPSATPGLPPSQTATPPPARTGTPASSPTASPAVVASQTPGPSATPPGAGTPSATPCAVSFSDVHPADYFYTPVLALACRGVIAGYADGTFRPFLQTTRAQMVKIVVLGFGLPIVTPAAGGQSFADVPPAFPFFPVIETATARGVVSGYACGGPGEPCDPQGRPYFRPFANVTRGQLSKIVVITAGWPLHTPAGPGSFADVAASSPFYPFVETAACHGVVSGYACGAPGEPCDPQRRPYFRQFAGAIRGQIGKIVYLSLTAGASCAP